MEEGKEEVMELMEGEGEEEVMELMEVMKE